MLPPIPLGNDLPSSLTLFDSSFTPPRRSTKKSSIQSKRYHKDNVCTSVLCGTCTGITHSLIKFKINFWWTKLTQMECGTNSAVHRPKPGQNLVIRAGFLFYFIFLHRVGNGLSIFAPRPGPGSSGAKKIVTRVLTPNYTGIPSKIYHLKRQKLGSSSKTGYLGCTDNPTRHNRVKKKD